MLIAKPKDKTLFCCWLRDRLVEQNRVETSTREETYRIDEFVGLKARERQEGE
ncbi:hypothetical protein BDL97_17G102100 [Sphagnum fallax]|nr:hypothetical protein BDL97_17G102100 [Sphagnum fallax]